MVVYQKVEDPVRGIVQSPLHHSDGLVFGLLFLGLLPANEVVVGIPLARLQVGQLTPAKDIAGEEFTAFALILNEKQPMSVCGTYRTKNKVASFHEGQHQSKDRMCKTWSG